MTFQERLAQKRERIEGNLPPQFLNIIQSSIRELDQPSIAQKVLSVGDTLPYFELLNQNNECISCTEKLEEGPLIITFYRGYWCAYCNLDLANLKSYVPEFEELGASMVTISPERIEYSKKIIAIQKLNFDIVWDQGNKVAEQFGLKYTLPEDLKELYRDKFGTNLKQIHGDDEWSLPMPARFLVDKNRKILYAEHSPDYTHRPDPDDLLKILQSIQ